MLETYLTEIAEALEEKWFEPEDVEFLRGVLTRFEEAIIERERQHQEEWEINARNAGYFDPET